MIQLSLGFKEFFLRKAIGWALRQYAWTDPAEIQRYVRGTAPLYRFTYSTNGQGIYGIDMETGKENETPQLSHAGRTLEPDLCRSQTPGATASPPCRSRTGAVRTRAATIRTSPSSG